MEPKDPPPEPGEVTRLLVAWNQGDPAAVERLMPLVYAELREIAGRHFRRERPGHTLQPTAVVHEAYFRLVDQTRVTWKNRGHFFAVASQAMRRILVDYARAHRADKRGGHELTGAPGPALENLGRSLKLFQAIIREDPANARAEVGLARLYESLGTAEEAQTGSGRDARLQRARDWYAKSRDAYLALRARGLLDRLTDAELEAVSKKLARG